MESRDWQVSNLQIIQVEVLQLVHEKDNIKMMNISPEVLKEAVDIVVDQLVGVTDLYPVQMELLHSLLQEKNIFFTSATNSGKTLPAVVVKLQS